MYFCGNSISMKFFLGIILIGLTFSCNTTNEVNNSTYFGGEIINPKSNFVLFLRDDKLVDTLLLDKNNRFLKEYKSLKEGLYTFKHGLEFQYIYLEPTDSVLVRLNTWDFDESLVFNGKGSNKNEFLINLFLQNEKEEYEKYNYFKLNEVAFQRKIDSLATERNAIFNHFSETETEVSEGFKKLTDAAIQFPLYRFKEIYPYFYKRAHKLKEFQPATANFYGYRNSINLNEENLVAFYPYQNYIINYLYNLSYQLKETDPSKDNISLNLLNLIIEHIKLEDFKNTLLKRIVLNDFFKSETTCGIDSDVMTVFEENCSNKNYIDEVKSLVHDSKIIVNNEPLNNFNVVSYNNENTRILDIIKDQHTVIYFWSTKYMSSDYLLNRIKYLENKYPEILFIGINLHPTLDDIKNDPSLKKLNLTKQYTLTADSYAHSFLTSLHPRAIIINKQGIVSNGFTYIDSHKFSSELNKLK